MDIGEACQTGKTAGFAIAGNERLTEAEDYSDLGLSRVYSASRGDDRRPSVAGPTILHRIPGPGNPAAHHGIVELPPDARVGAKPVERDGASQYLAPSSTRQARRSSRLAPAICLRP
jgi:hypothetical protein